MEVGMNKEQRNKGENYGIDEKKWPEGEKFGWNISKVFDSRFWEDEYESQWPGAKQFIKEELPEIFEQFYQKVLDGLIEGGIDEDDAIETMEELAATQLSELLIGLAIEYNGQLIKKVS